MAKEDSPVLARVRQIQQQKAQGVDPNIGNPRKMTPKTPDLEQVGRDLYQSLKSRGKLRGR